MDTVRISLFKIKVPLFYFFAYLYFILANQAIHGVKWINPTRVVSFSCDESSEKQGTYKNTLCWLGKSFSIILSQFCVHLFYFLFFFFLVDIQSGKTREFRRISAPEPTFIRGIRVSPLRQYLILLLKDRPFELWDLRTFSLTRTFKQFTVCLYTIILYLIVNLLYYYVIGYSIRVGNT